MKHHRFISLPIVIASVLLLPPQANAQKVISRDLFGIFIEDLNYTADGGLYGELIQNRSFEYSPSDIDSPLQSAQPWHWFTAWEMVRPASSIVRMSLESKDPIHPNNRHYLSLDVKTPGRTGAGVANNGFDGIEVKEGQTYDFSIFARTEGTEPMPATVCLMVGTDTVAGGRFEVNSTEWHKHELTLTARQTGTARLVLCFHRRGVVDIDMVSLFPQDTFRGRKNGLRRDLAETIEALHPAFVRFPGGCLAHGDGIDNLYDWKKTIGPVEQRASDANIWNYHQTFGMGYFEYLQFCEDIGAKPLPVMAAGVSCQNSARTRGTGQECIPMEQMDDYIQDILDFVEYCRGDASTQWGAKRIAAGHEAPFQLEYLGIGNEDHITPAFEERFSMIVRAVHARYPDLKIIGTSGPSWNGPDYDKGWALARKEQASLYAVDEHYYNSVQWYLENMHRYDTYDRTGPKVYLGEFASRGNAVSNAITEAAYMLHLEQNGDVVSLCSYAPLLARNGHTQWRPDMIYFDANHIYPTVNYEVIHLFGQMKGDRLWPEAVTCTDPVSATCVTDSRTGDVIIKMANPTDQPANINIDLSHVRLPRTHATLYTISGPPNHENPKDAQQAADGKWVRTVQEELKIKRKITHTIAPWTMQVIRIH